ncbi:MAG: hypothetical protein C4314_05040 [Thermoflexus sp.]
MVLTERLTVSTGGKDEVVDLTEPVAERVARCGLRAVFVPGSTAGLTTMEFEPGAVADLQRWFAEMVPADRPYRHNLRWGDQNGHSHLRASLIGPSLTIPFRDGRLLLGTWQQIVLIDFDVRPRRRGMRRGPPRGPPRPLAPTRRQHADVAGDRGGRGVGSAAGSGVGGRADADRPGPGARGAGPLHPG